MTELTIKYELSDVAGWLVLLYQQIGDYHIQRAELDSAYGQKICPYSAIVVAGMLDRQFSLRLSAPAGASAWLVYQDITTDEPAITFAKGSLLCLSAR